MNIENQQGEINPVYLKNLLKTMTQRLVEYKCFILKIMKSQDKDKSAKGNVFYEITGYKGKEKVSRSHDLEEFNQNLQKTVLSFFLDVDSAWEVESLTLTLDRNGVFIQTEKFMFFDTATSLGIVGSQAGIVRNFVIHKDKVDQAEVFQFQDSLTNSPYRHVRIIGRDKIQYFYGNVENFDLRIEDSVR